MLNPRYRFEQFVVGPSNQQAHAAGMATAAGARAPLVIHGSAGVGKSHLLNAIGLRALEQRPNARVVHLNAERFALEFDSARHQRRLDEFRAQYRTHLDLLLVDDVQVLVAFDEARRELGLTVQALAQADKQLVLASEGESLPITGLYAKSLTRGIVTCVRAPELATRLEFLRRRAEQERLIVAEGVASFLAEQCPQNMRELESQLLRLAVKAELLSRPLDLALAHEVIGVQRASAPRRRSAVTTRDVQHVIAHYFRARTSRLKPRPN